VASSRLATIAMRVSKERLEIFVDGSYVTEEIRAMAKEILALREVGDVLYHAADKAHDCRNYYEDPRTVNRRGETIRAGGGVDCTILSDWMTVRSTHDPEWHARDQESAKRLGLVTDPETGHHLLPRASLKRMAEELLERVTSFQGERPSDRGCKHSAQSWYIDKDGTHMGCEDCDEDSKHE
jgi:hypothetical protein